MAKKRDTGTKFRIIFVKHSLTRVFRTLLFGTVLILLAWWIAPYTPGFFSPPNDIYLVWLGILFVVLMVMALFFRNRAYAQARPKFLQIKVPLVRVRIPYDLIENVRMVMLKDVYDKKKMNWAQRRFLTHYFPKTVVTVNLTQFPFSEGLIRLILPSYLLIPSGKGKGFVIHTKDYLAFSTEVDSRLNAARTLGTGAVSKKPREEEKAFDGFFDLDQG